jgi:hypothetical protein
MTSGNQLWTSAVVDAFAVDMHQLIVLSFYLPAAVRVLCAVPHSESSKVGVLRTLVSLEV